MSLENFSSLNNKKIMLCITASIAAYKAAAICSKLVKLGVEVYPVLSPNALYFINPNTFSAISGKKAIYEQFINEEKVYHISLSHSIDAVLIAPATVNTISKLACGICDNFLTTAVISSNCPVLIAPAMNESMYLNHSVQENIEKLSKSGKYFFIEPAEGRLACGEEGIGKLADEDLIISRLSEIVRFSNELSGKSVIITAGGTIEFIDSVRYISNRSSGKMGFALAEEAYFRGAKKVLLITTSKYLQKPYGVELKLVENTDGMKNEVLKYYNSSDVIIMAAAVSDIVPEERFDYKLKKNDDIISKLKFKENINILKILAEKKNKDQLLVGFSAESGEKIENTMAKMDGIDIDLMVLNDISNKDIGFESDYNEVTIISKDGKIRKTEKSSKRIIARKIWNEILKYLS
jgi:phosphopantothenoylcysteine decarboxylase/phosphopantothenate--cysteine ligase